MNFKKEIENLLNALKNLGYDRRKIEQELGYGENYIDQALSRGGNKKLLNGLDRLQKSILQNATPVIPLSKDLLMSIIEQAASNRAFVTIILREFAPLYADFHKTTIEDAERRLQSLIRRESDKLFDLLVNKWDVK